MFARYQQSQRNQQKQNIIGTSAVLENLSETFQDFFSHFFLLQSFTSSSLSLSLSRFEKPTTNIHFLETRYVNKNLNPPSKFSPKIERSCSNCCCLPAAAAAAVVAAVVAAAVVAAFLVAMKSNVPNNLNTAPGLQNGRTRWSKRRTQRGWV